MSYSEDPSPRRNNAVGSYDYVWKIIKKLSRYFERRMQQNLIIQDVEICLTRKRIKHLILRISREGEVKVSAPLRCSQKNIEAFLHQKIDWILNSKRKIAQRATYQSSNIETGAIYWHSGVAYILVINQTTSKQKIMIDGDKLHFFVFDHTSEEEKRLLLCRWQRQQMKLMIPKLIDKWEKIIGVHALQWGLKSMKTRWGSCNTTAKRIWLNLHLIHKPLICLEYVIVHELVHLLEPSHNQRFHGLMNQFMPEWKIIKKQLNSNQINVD